MVNYYFRYDASMIATEVIKTEISTGEKFVDVHTVPLDAPLSLLDQFNCHYVCFHLMSTEVSTSISTSRNAINILMSSSKEKRLPQPIEGANQRADHQLYNKLLEVLGTLKVGWSPCVVESTGKRFVQKLANCLWYLDCHHDNFVGQGIHIPQLFAQFQGFNDFKAKKIKKKTLLSRWLMRADYSFVGCRCFLHPLHCRRI